MESALIRLTESQIAENWDTIKESIQIAFPPMIECTEVELTNIFSQLLAGRAQCWFLYVGEDVRAIVITVVTTDVLAKTKALLIYSICSTGKGKLPQESWTLGLNQLSRFGLACGCEYLTGYTSNPVIIKMTAKLQGSSHMAYVKFKLGDQNE